MYQAAPHLWIGPQADARRPDMLFAEAIEAVVDLAPDETALNTPREVVYLRIPLVDGTGNPPWRLRAAVEVTMRLLTRQVPTLVVCGAGISRSVAIAAAALSHVSRSAPPACLERLARRHAVDVSPGLWTAVLAALADAEEKPEAFGSSDQTS